jgi:4-amino-4-deoxy-L-arabinose transferase-like glycosyltransferase
MPTAFSPTRRDIFIAGCIVLFAFALRVFVVFDRAYRDWAFDPLPQGSDQLTYVSQAQQYEAGTWPNAAFNYQPGITYFFVGIRLFSGGSLGTMRIFSSGVGALSCGVLIGAGWLLTRKRWGGYLAGGLMAVYPPAIFYSTVLLDPFIATFYLSLFIFFALWQRERLALWRTLGLGLLIGLLTITRSNLALIVLAWPVYLAAIASTRKQLALHIAVFALGVVIPIAPVTLWNIKSGSGFQLVTNVGLEEVYRANNRDATGQRSGDPAIDTVQGSYMDALLTDIALNPLRFIELQGHKAGLYWDDGESGNNIDFFLNGKLVSPLLNAIPLDFRILAALGLVGLGVMFYSRLRLQSAPVTSSHPHPPAPSPLRREGEQNAVFKPLLAKRGGVWGGDARFSTALFLTLLNMLIFVGVMALWIEGRLRQPAIVPLIVTAAYLLVRLPDMAHAKAWRPLFVPSLLVALLFGFSEWSIYNLPTKRPVAAVPDDLRAMNVVFDNTVRFLGWRTLPQWTAPGWGWGAKGYPYAVELYWELLEATDTDYNFYLAYVDGGKRYAARDREIGGISYPGKLTSQWRPGEVYSEIAGFRFLPQADLPTEHSGEIQLGVYVWDEQGLIKPVLITAPETGNSYVVLQRFALVDVDTPASLPEMLTVSDLVFGPPGGDQIALKGYTLPGEGTLGEHVTLSFYWQALQDVREDYNLFVHVMDADDHLAASYDGPPRAGLFVTSTWPFIQPVRDDVPLTLPETPGTYKIYIGLTHFLSKDRLPVSAQDNRPLLGEIVVR